MNLLDALDDLDELNRHMDADPGLAMNMAEMGFIKRVPFQLDHNQATVAKWAWTDYGRREMLQRIEAGFEFAVQTGKERKQ
jgi:hypothetical protein